MKKERVLYFSYSFEMKDNVEKLKDVLRQNNIEFICYESTGYYNFEFIVRKSGKKWNDIYALINSVYPSFYRFKDTNMEVCDGKLVEVVY